MARVQQVCLLVILLVGQSCRCLQLQVQTEPPSSCPDIGTVRKNNWPEDQIQLITSETAPGVTDVSWAPYVPSDDYLDASLYVDVTYNQATQEIEFTALPALAGVRDYPQKGYPTLAQLSGVCQMTCGSDSGEFQFILLVQDRNTASPSFTSPSPSVTVPETFPTGFVIPSLVISASDADADATNYELSFELSEGSPFSLTEAVKTGDLLPTYTTQLKLEKELDWAKNPTYQLTITSRDPGGLSAEATVNVTVIDVDTMQPQFEQDLYTATVDDPETPGPLDVSIKAIDPDTPGKLFYELLVDPAASEYAEYFSLDPDTAELNLTKNITSMVQDQDTIIHFLLQATEDGGQGFSCRAELLITLPAEPGPPPRCPVISPIFVSDWPEDQTGIITSRAVPRVTRVFWAPFNSSSQHLDASEYIHVTVNTDLQTLEFTATPAMYGIVDFGSQTFPNPVVMGGTCILVCDDDVTEVQFTLVATDSNTAAPVFGSDVYTVHVMESLPVGMVVGSLIMAASDSDAKTENHEISFTMAKDSPFSLTDPVKTGDLLPTYTTQLKLEKELVWADNSTYQLTVTAQDPKGNQTDAVVDVSVIPMNAARQDDPVAPPLLQKNASTSHTRTAAGFEHHPQQLVETPVQPTGQ